MTRTELHRLVDELPEDSLDAVAAMLRLARDPLLAGLEAAVHEDPLLGPEQDTGIEEGWAAYQRGEAFSVSELRGGQEGSPPR
jgi:hypothetical protein